MAQERIAGFRKQPLNILLSRSNAIYYPGDTISGQVHMNVTRTQTTKGVLIKFMGWANILISKEVTRTIPGDEKEHKWTLSRIQDEPILDMTFYLIGNQKGKDHKIEPGLYKFPFEFKVPFDCPATFTSEHGNVKYTLCVENRNHLLGTDEATCEMYVTLIGSLDLNRIPQLRRPANTLVMHKIQKLYCCSAGSVGFKFDVKRTGYAPGEYIDFYVEIYNHSKQAQFIYINMELLQICRCNAHDISDSTSQRMSHADGTDFPCPSPGEHAEWKGSIPVPECTPTDFGSQLDIINLTYELKVQCRFETDTNYDVEASIPIVIGTIGYGKKKPNPPKTPTTSSLNRSKNQDADQDSDETV